MISSQQHRLDHLEKRDHPPEYQRVRTPLQLSYALALRMHDLVESLRFLLPVESFMGQDRNTRWIHYARPAFCFSAIQLVALQTHSVPGGGSFGCGPSLGARPLLSLPQTNR